MHPSKVRNLLPSFAMETNHSVEEVEAVTKFYYKTLRSKLSSLEQPVVHVHNLGNFYIKEKALTTSIGWCDNYLEKLSSSDITEYGMRKAIRIDNEAMKKIRTLIENERQRRRELLNKRYGNQKERNTDLEK